MIDEMEFIRTLMLEVQDPLFNVADWEEEVGRIPATYVTDAKDVHLLIGKARHFRRRRLL